VNAQAAAQPRAEALAPSRTLADRVLAVVPLLSVFVWLAIVYAWESWDHGTPWLFTDELELTQLARSIAHTGHAARRGQPHSFDSLYTYLTAPAWWLSSIHTSYATVKYMGVLLMSATVFPAYFLARTIASPRASIFAAAAAGTIPALVYSSFVLEESLAYPWATLCLFLIAKAFLTSSRRWTAAAGVASVLAPLMKGELVVIPAVFALTGVFMLSTGARAQRWRRRWSRSDWIGAATLVLGVVFLLSAVGNSLSAEYLEVSRLYKTRVLTHALWGGGALAIGIGILPLLVAAGTMLRAPGERPSRALRVFRCLLLASVVLFGLYTGVKGAYNQNHFATRVWERNVIYLSPLFFAATALWLDRRRLNLVALGVGVGLAAYLIGRTPYEMQYRFNSDAPGLAILEQANRSLSFTPTDAKTALYCVLAASVILLLAPQALRRRSAAWVGAIAAGLVAILVLAWNGTGEISAAVASNQISDSFRASILGPLDWAERRTHGARTLYIGQGITDPNPEWLLEFWNPSVQDVWSLDGTAPGPGPITTPDVRGRDGLLISHPLNHDRYAVAEPGVDIAGKVIAHLAHRAGGGTRNWRLVRVDPPLRLLGAETGLYADNWSGPTPATYTRYDRGRGTVRVHVSRVEWGGPDVPGKVTIRMGTVVIGADHQPHIGRVTAVRRWTVHAHKARDFVLPTAGNRFRVEVTVTPTFKPHALVPELSDNRPLGAVIDYRFRPSRKR
jgi:hypothetical protein